MSLHVLPTPIARAAHAATPPDNPRNAGTCGIFYVAGKLGEANRAPGYLCRTLDALIGEDGFPAPFPLHRAGKLVKGAHRDSKWPLVAVDAWFDDRLPPSARAVIGMAERAEIDSRLSANAAKLFGAARAGVAA